MGGIKYKLWDYWFMNTDEKQMLKCPLARECGGCSAINTPYEEQLKTKDTKVRELFAPFLNDSVEVLPILGMEEPYFYRNKVISPFVWGPRKKTAAQKGVKQTGKQAHLKNKRQKTAADREILIGMYAKGTHKVINSTECLIENKQAKQVILATRRLCYRYHIEPYNEDTGRGFLRHALVRVGHESGEVLVTLVTNTEDFPGAKNFCKELKKACPFITSIVQNVNTRQTNVILGKGRERTLYGPGFILDKLCGLSFRISSQSFYQVNSTQTERLYRTAVQFAQLTGKERILDAYCGTGTIGLVALTGLGGELPGARELIGVDAVASSIADARQNAHHNGIQLARFVSQDATEFIKELVADKEQIDVLFLDPPRAGSTEEFLSAAASLNPERMVYISCNPETQVRDLNYLEKQGYRMTRLQAVDMFPHSDHIETVCLIERKS